MSHRSHLLACAVLFLVTSCNSGGGGGGGLVDHGACDLLIDCATDLAPESRDQFIAAYGQFGTCWQAGPQAWQACRDACRMSLDALNLVAMANGDSCGTCQTDADCAEYGVGAHCEVGLCIGGSDDTAHGETGEGSGDGDGDGDGDPSVPLEGVSIVLVVDNSASMSRPQRTLALHAAQMLAPLDAAGIPWRLGITTTDNGNPWCPAGQTTPEAGQLQLASCRSRLNEYQSPDFDATDYLCLDICTSDNFNITGTSTVFDPTPKQHPWIESNNGEVNISGVTLAEALPCLIPQGLRGCGFESQIESAYLNVARSKNQQEDEYGFTDPNRLLVIVMVTDEADCSYNKDWSVIFDANGDKTFWSDPTAAFPTSAVCWNAGMLCKGDPSGYDDCIPVNLDVDGNATTDFDLAVLHPVEERVGGIIDKMGSPDAVLAFGIVGVQGDGLPYYADTTASDPEYQDAFGIGPSCAGTTSFGFETAVPPGRIWTMLEELGPESGRRAWSICSEDFDNALVEIGDAIVAKF